MITYSCFLGKSDHDQAIIGDHDQTRITDHGRTRMSDHDRQEYPGRGVYESEPLHVGPIARLQALSASSDFDDFS